MQQVQQLNPHQENLLIEILDLIPNPETNHFLKMIELEIDLKVELKEGK